MGLPSYFDLLAEYGIEGAHPGGLNLTKKILAGEVLNNKTRLLDVGCGTGQTSAYIAQKYQCQVTAVDINSKMLEKAAQRFKKHNLKIELIQADAGRLPFRPHSFDIVLAESVTIFTAIREALSEYSRILKPGGTLIDVELTAKTALTTEELSELDTFFGLEQVPQQEEWLNMFQQAGFLDIQFFQTTMQQFFLPSPGLMKAFADYFKIMRKYKRKFGCRVYKCKL